LVRSRFNFLELLGGLRDLLRDFDSLLLLDTDFERFLRESRVDRFSSLEDRSRFLEEYSLVLELFRAGGDSDGDLRERRFDVLDFLGGLSDLDFDLDRSLEELLLLRRGMPGKLGNCCVLKVLLFCKFFYACCLSDKLIKSIRRLFSQRHRRSMGRKRIYSVSST